MNVKDLMTDYCFTVLHEDIEVARVEITEYRKMSTNENENCYEKIRRKNRF